MTAVAKVIGVVASVAALIPGPHQPIAAGIAFVANATAQLTAKKPRNIAQGSTTDVKIGADMPTPYIMGDGVYYTGNRVHQIGYGGTVDDVPNPYAALVDIYSGVSCRALVATYADFTPIVFSGTAASGWFNGFLYRSFQLGALPESSALTGNWGAIPQWSSAHKLSGKAAILWSAKFDKRAERFASGLPRFGSEWDGVSVYDGRQDSTWPGGDGPCRAGDESTYVGGDAATNPGCHALTYALGRYQNGVKVFGIGLLGGPVTIDGTDIDGIVVEDFVEFANVCEANGWKVAGVIFEPGDRWNNLKQICAAGGAEPCFKGSKLGLKINAPRIPVGTITIDDLAEGELTAPGMQSWRDRRNTILPKYRSRDHKWEYVATDPVVIADYLTEDGEEKSDNPQYDLVEDADQAAQLGAYSLFDGRERGPIEMVCKSHMRFFRPGDMLTCQLPGPEYDLDDVDVVIIKRSIDPETMQVNLTAVTEFAGKHALALATTGTAPAAIVIPSPEELDTIAGQSKVPRVTELIADVDGTDVTLSWRMPSQQEWGYVQPYRSATNDFDDAAPLGDAIIAAQGEPWSIVDAPGTGTFYYWVQTFDVFANAYPAVGPVEAVV